MPTTTDRRSTADWSQAKIDYEFIRALAITDALARQRPVLITAPALLDRAAQALSAARRTESP